MPAPPTASRQSAALEATVRRIVDTLARRRPGDHDLLDLPWADIGIDSLDLLDLAVACEDEVGHAIPDVEVARWSDARQVVAYLERAASA